MATSTRSRAAATADSFAHLAGLGRGPARAAEDETDDERREREDKEQAGRDQECAKKEAAGEDTGESEEEKEDRKGREEARRKARRAKGENSDPDEDGDDDSDKEEMRSPGPAAAARRRERTRCAAIFATQAAGRNPVLAAHLAFGTELSRGEAIRVLRDTPAPLAQSRADRTAANPSLGPGGGPAPTGSQSQSLWDRALVNSGAVPARR